MTHNACSLMSSEGVARRPCSGSHMPSFSRSDKWTMQVYESVILRHSPSSTDEIARRRVTIRIIDVLDELAPGSSSSVFYENSIRIGTKRDVNQNQLRARNRGRRAGRGR